MKVAVAVPGKRSKDAIPVKDLREAVNSFPSLSVNYESIESEFRGCQDHGKSEWNCEGGR